MPKPKEILAKKDDLCYTDDVMKDVYTINENKNNDFMVDESEELEQCAEKHGKFEQDNY